MMKMKKLGAVIVSALMAVGMMTGCSVGAGGSLNLSNVNDLLMSDDIVVTADTKLDSVVAAVAGGATVGIGKDKIADNIAKKMDWSIEGTATDLVLQVLKDKVVGGGVDAKVQYGTTYIVSEDKLKAGVNPSELGLSDDTAAELLPIDSVDDVAAAMVLRQNAILKNPINPASTYGFNLGNLGNIVGSVGDKVEGAWNDHKDEIGDAVGDVVDKAEDAWNNNKDDIVNNAGNAVGEAAGSLLQKYVVFTYNVSAYPIMSLNGSTWIISVQVTARPKV